MQISCDCGSFKARLTAFPKNTPGRLVCYCRDCQSFLEKIDRKDVLDNYGGTEVIPVYPGEIEFLQGQDHLKCNRLTKRGTNRWTASCCNSPIANLKAGFPWVGLFRSTYSVENNRDVEALGSVRGRIFGRDAIDGAPYKIADKIGLRETLIVMPFILKGKIFKKHRGSPFFNADDKTPTSKPELLS